MENNKREQVMQIVSSAVMIVALVLLLIMGVIFMKTSKTINVVNIVISAVLVGLLAAGLIVGIHFLKKGDLDMFGLGTIISNNFSGGDDWHTEPYIGDGSGICGIDIGWANGAIDMKVVEGTELTFSEDGDTSDYKMCWKIVDGELYVRYSAKKFIFIGKIPKKTLTFTLPSSLKLQDLKIKTASGSTDVDGVDADWFEVDSASGSTNIRNCTAEKMLLDSASGKTFVKNCVVDETIDIDSASGAVEVRGTVANVIDIDSASGKKTLEDCECAKLTVDSSSGALSYSGKATNVDVDSSSGAITLSLDEKTENVDISISSGSTKIYLPENAGFDVDASLASGKLKCEFADARSGKDSAFREGDGNVKIKIDGASGSVTITPR